MGKRVRDKESGISNGINSHHTHAGRVWGILHIIKYHHWRHVKRRITQRRPCNGPDDSRNDEIPETSDDSMRENLRPSMPLSNVEEENKLGQSTQQNKYSIKSKIKALLNEETYKMRGRHKRSSTCPTKSQLTRIDSVHHLEVDPLSEMLLTVENREPVLETFQNHLAAGTLEVLSPVISRKNSLSNNSNDKCVECGAAFSSEPLEKHDHRSHHKHRNLSMSDGLQEDKLINAKILTTDASPLLFKDFLDALDLINTNKDFLLKYMNDPGSPLPFELHTQPHSPNAKSRRAKSISLPVGGSSSSDNLVDELLNSKKEIESEIQNLADFHKPSTSSSSHKANHQLVHSDQESVERDYKETSSGSSQVSNNVKNKNFKDLRKKIKHIIEESKNEKLRIKMDAVVDKIPRGNKFSKNVRKLMSHEKFKQNNKHQLSSGLRTSSLKESVGRYSQLYDTCFHKEVVSNKEEKPPKSDSLKLKTEEKSSVLKTPKSFKRFLSLPNLKSYFNQNEDPSVLLSPQNSVRKSEDRTRSSSLIDGYSNSEILSPSPAPSDHTNEESKVIVNTASDSGSDVNDDVKSEKSIGFDGLGNLRDTQFSGSNEQDIGYATESSTMLVEGNSAFSSDTSFLDSTFELENLNILEESDQELKPMLAGDELNYMYEQQEAKTDQFEEVENFLKHGYKIPCNEIDTNNEAAFNYVKKVLDLSGFTSNESLETWYSDYQPLDPSIYQELEGCLLLDPDCSGNCEGGHCNHLLLFDIINEGLLEIFGRSYNYYPRPLSSLSHVHRLPNGRDDVLHKVWKLITWYLSSAPPDEAYQSLDYYVSKDLARNDGWMNLQFDSECVGLEIDDLIFDDLLDDIIYS
ncbi:unnamed protein product [Vicia faba]|uniref:DUF4378 domain-containing protein n=1 Tax=Vicia faba TaxID=3906 RepID=A0AAV0ZY11_VICFA|nr:unnamed protein product [Vicia faba]